MKLVPFIGLMGVGSDNMLYTQPNASSIKKQFTETLVYVDGKPVTNVRIEDNKIVLDTK